MADQNRTSSTPPFNAQVIDENGLITPEWLKFFSQNASIMQNLLQANGRGSGEAPIVTLNAPKISKSDRDAIDSPKDGSIIYNTTDNDFNFRVNGSWTTK